MITEEFCLGPAPGKVKDSPHNPSAVFLPADRRPDAHPLSARFLKKSCTFQACHFLQDTCIACWLEFPLAVSVHGSNNMHSILV